MKTNVELLEHLRSPTTCPSVIWKVCQHLFKDCRDWHADTFALELSRRKIPPSPSLMVRILGAQTVVTTNTWARNYEAFFAFALACDGIPFHGEYVPHPVVAQLAWAVCEIEALREKKPDDDEGFDPDDVDPAIVAVALDEGFAVLPNELSFAQRVHETYLRGMTREEINSVKKNWDELKRADRKTVGQFVEKNGSRGHQIALLYDVQSYVQGKSAQREVLLKDLQAA